MGITIADADTVRQLLTMPACIGVLDTAMRAVSRGDVSAPPRLFAPLYDDSGTLGLMPGSAKGLDVYGAKIISLHPDNPAKGLPAIQGFVALFDFDNGELVGLIDGASVTAIRTAAASGLATRELSRAEACTHGIFGTGVQAATHIDAIAAVRQIEQVVVWGRDEARTRAFCEKHAERTGLDVVAGVHASEAAACDIVSTATSSFEPVLEGDWVQPGAHVNLVGAHQADTRESDTALIKKARVYVDLLESALNEAGDLLIPLNSGDIDKDHILGEIGGVLNGTVAGRTDDEAITLYKSLGIVGQDLFAADYVLNRLRSG